MLKIRYITQMRIQIAHDGNDALCAFIPMFTILQGDAMIYHFLDMSTIFRNDQLRTLCIVFYCVYQNYNVFKGNVLVAVGCKILKL